jgi:ribosome-binding factor A
MRGEPQARGRAPPPAAADEAGIPGLRLGAARASANPTMRHKRAIPNRSHRVADQIQRDVAELIRDLKDPRVGMVTVNSVEVSPDYAHAKVYFSVLVGEPRECEQALNEAAGWLRNGLFKRLAIHTVPTLHFHFDRSTERAAELSELIARANASRARDEP